MAGAVSAGAYTAGVADFLIEAMDAWTDARAAGDPLAPPHRVRLTALTGASAGAMTAAIVAGILAGRRHQPLRARDPGFLVEDNALFDSWVNRAGADALLGADDLGAGSGRLGSLLNGEVLAQIAAAALPEGAGGAPKAWVGDGVRLAFTVTNLRGVPYNIGFTHGDGMRPPRPGHGMRLHADTVHFRLGADDDRAGRAMALPWTLGGAGWHALRRAALASGAFPLLLPPHRLSRPGADYGHRLWPLPGSGERVGDHCDCVRHEPLPPHWGAAGTPAQYDFIAVDGGVLDNEPFALGRELLVGAPPRRPDGDVLGRALLTIDPFPDVAGYRADERQPGGLLDLALALLAAMKNQTRFKPDELVTAADDPYASRQLIAPSRRVDGERRDPPLAGGAVDGFAGFLERDFRLHDFHLGRANAQRFLQRHFRLPATHPLFAGWSPAQRTAFADERGDLPIVPLLGAARTTAYAPPWPTLPPHRLDELRTLLRRRVRALLPYAIEHLLARSSRPMRWATRLLARFQSTGWVDAIVEHLRRELARRGQL